MEKYNVIELNLNDLVQINGGTNEDAYKTGVAAGELVGKMVKNFLTLTGVWKLISLL
jgi:hypothetical protein